VRDDLPGIVVVRSFDFESLLASVRLPLQIEAAVEVHVTTLRVGEVARYLRQTWRKCVPLCLPAGEREISIGREESRYFPGIVSAAAHVDIDVLGTARIG